MALTLEWQHHLENWERILWQLCYRPLGEVTLSGFTTLKRFTPVEALRQPFTPMPAGTAWGAKWEYGWFKGSFSLPPETATGRIILRMEPGGESLAWLKDPASGEFRVAGSTGWARCEITLHGEPGEPIEFLVESYAGHGKVSVGKGPVPYGGTLMPEPGPTQTTTGHTTYGLWHEDIYQLAVDFTTLFQLRSRLDPLSLRVDEIDEALMQAAKVFDPELPEPELLESARCARQGLQPALACNNGSTAPTLFAFGHAHIDVAWLWPLAETERKIARTMINQLNLFAEYPEFRFLQSQPQLYVMLRQHYPGLYARVKAAVEDGQIIPDGSMWVEADTNIAGGEALVRQVMYGRSFFQQEFGIDSRVLWLPDVFGYSGALPQILRGCGCTGFATQKITWAYNGGERFPYNTFLWEGIDGTTIPAHIFTEYNSQTRPNDLLDRWETRLQHNGLKTMLLSFGWGDGGGGPTRDHVEFLRRAADLEGLPRVRYASPQEFFADLEQRGIPQQGGQPCRYVGELYFQAHRGTYTSQARTKKGNRRSELALRSAELWGTAANRLAGFPFDAQILVPAWQKLLLQQFHDILPGSSIHRVYEEAEAAFAEVIQAAENTTTAALRALVGAGLVPAQSGSTPAQSDPVLDTGQVGATQQPSAQSISGSGLSPLQAESGNGGSPNQPQEVITVFNPLNWSRSEVVETPWGLQEVTVPSCGWTTVYPVGTTHPAHALTHTASDTFPKPVTAGIGGLPEQPSDTTVAWLENEYLRVEVNARGELSRLFDKASGFEVLAGTGNQLRLYKDVPTMWDAWDLDSLAEQQPLPLDEPAVLELLSAGPFVAELRVQRPISRSQLTQVIRLRRGSRRLDFATTIDWREKHRLLKVAFPLNIHANEAIHEVQFGHLRRPNHRSRPYDADRFEVSNHKWSALAEESRGAAVLNDCKYGLSVQGNSINLTLLKSAQAPDPQADQGEQTFTYALYPWNGSLADSGVVQQAYELNVPVQAVPGSGGEGLLFSLDASNIILETVKPAEDGSGDLVLRLYESMRTTTRAVLTSSLPFRLAWQTDMLENLQAELPLQDGKLVLDFRPFEIKTVRLKA